jgi:hypothetical protein
VAAATAVSVALNVAHAPYRLAAQLFAALPPVALLGALELLMSVARTGLLHTSRTQGSLVDAPASPSTPPRAATAIAHRPRSPSTSHRTAPQVRTRTQRPHPTRGLGSGYWSPANAPAAPRVTAAEVIAATGRSRRRAYELLRDARTEQE